MLDWIQSFDGVMSLTVWGVSLGSLVTSVVSIIRLRKSNVTLKSITNAFSKSEEEIERLKQEKEELEEEKVMQEAQYNLERKQNAEINSFNLKALSIIIGQSSGISAADKIDLINDAEKIQERVFEEGEKQLLQLKEKISKVDEIIEKGKELKDKAETNINKIKETAKETIEEGKTLLEKYLKKD